MSPDKERKETLTVDVIMDENMIPESINWHSTQENDKRDKNKSINNDSAKFAGPRGRIIGRVRRINHKSQTN